MAAAGPAAKIQATTHPAVMVFQSFKSFIISLLPSVPRQTKIVTGWSGDGEHILYRSEQGGAKDLGYLELEPSGDWTAHPYVATPASEDAGSFSPDGRFVAYVSGGELVARPFPEADRHQWPVSPSGVVVRGQGPRWTRGGTELIYAESAGEGRLALVAVRVGLSDDNIVVGARETLFEVSDDIGGWDVTADGRRFLIAEPAGQTPKPGIIVVENWYEEFRKFETTKLADMQ